MKVVIGPSNTSPMPVVKPGAASASSSAIFEYSNSKATITSPMPIAIPLSDRVDGVVDVPQNAVRSAEAGRGRATSKSSETSPINANRAIRSVYGGIVINVRGSIFNVGLNTEH